MSDPEYTIKRTIEDVTFSELAVEEIREQVRHDLLDEGVSSIDEETVEKRVQEKLLEIAQDRTLADQGDHRLHNDIEHSIDK